MSELSESAYWAAWLQDLEYVLRRAVSDWPFDLGRLRLIVSHISNLREVSAACGGWIRLDEVSEEAFVPMAQWMKIYDGELA